MANAQKIPDDLLKCPICMDRYKSPRMLPCIHSFCAICIEKVIKKTGKDVFPCPECHKEVKVPDEGVRKMTVNYYLQNLVDKHSLLEKNAAPEVKAQTCEQCNKRVVAAFCEDCNCALCGDCLAMFKHHKTVPLTKLRQNVMQKKNDVTKVPNCSSHPTEFLHFFCKTCNKLICRDCAVIEHSKPKHQCVDAEDQLVQMKRILHADLQKTQAAVVNCTEYMDAGNAAAERVGKDTKDLKKLLFTEKKKRMRQLERILQAEINEIVEELEGCEAEKTKELAKHQKDAFYWMMRMEKSKQITSKVLEGNNMWEILGVGSELHNSFDSLESDAKSMVIDSSLGHLQKSYTPRETVKGTIGDMIHCVHFSKLPNPNKALFVSYDKYLGRVRVGIIKDGVKVDEDNIHWSNMIALKNHEAGIKVSVASSPTHVLLGYTRNVIVIGVDDFTVQKEVVCDNQLLSKDTSVISNVIFNHETQYTGNNRFIVVDDEGKFTLINIPGFTVGGTYKVNQNVDVRIKAAFGGTSLMCSEKQSGGVYQQSCNGKYGRLIEKAPEDVESGVASLINCGLNISDHYKQGYNDNLLYANPDGNNVYNLSMASWRFIFGWFVLWTSRKPFQCPDTKWKITEYRSGQNNNHFAYLDGPAGSDVPIGFFAENDPAVRNGMLLTTCDANARVTIYARGPWNGTPQDLQEYKIKL